MMNLNLNRGRNEPLKVLCLGAHSDDIEIGCGGTILRLADEYPQCTFHWVVFSAIGIRKTEAEQAAHIFAGSRLGTLTLHEFQDGFMPFTGAEIKKVFEGLKPVSPDIVLTHYRKDAHQDHRLLSELTWNTFRNHLIMEYEIPKYDGDLGSPSFFVPLSADIYRAKVSHLMNAFASQRSKQWFDESTFQALMRLRGMECASPSNYAEAFYCRKLVY